MTIKVELSDRVKALLLKINEEWNKAESVIKRSEQVNGDVITPAIKELRYTGRRLAAALELIATGKPDDDIEPLLHDALHNCYRARHDAVDVAVAKILEDVEIALRKLGYNNCRQCFPGVGDLVRSARAAQVKIAQARGVGEARDEIYQALEDIDISDLAAKYEDFLHTEDFIKQMARQDRRNSLGKTLVTITSTAVAVLALVVAYASWKHPNTPTDSAIDKAPTSQVAN